MKKILYNIKPAVLMVRISTVLLSSMLLLNSCSRDFLNPATLSFFEPDEAYTTEAGLAATLTTSDKHLRDYYWPYRQLTEYMFSDIGVRGKTDDANMLTNIDQRITPTNMLENTKWFWDEGYAGVKYANTVISYIDRVEGLDENIKNAYLGRAYFHRSFRYLLLVFQFNDVPLVSKLPEVPKQNYKSTARAAILDMITENMEFAVEWVPDQSNMSVTGTVNKAACRQLLIKCYLATGQFQKAKEQADILIEQSGFSLMTEPFGQFMQGGEPETWQITRNVIWDMHRPENKLIAANKEVLFGVVNRGAGSSFANLETMRVYNPFVNDNKIRGTDNLHALPYYVRNNAAYRKNTDWARAIGRGIAEYSPSYFAKKAVRYLNGVLDEGDLRYSSKMGNWVSMDSLRYQNIDSEFFGKTFAEHQPAHPDTIRAWFDFPHYKTYLFDKQAEDNLNTNSFNGATSGSIADWYIYRLAETYLLRAEANYYLGNAALAAQDVNEVRKRAKCEQLYPQDGTFTIGGIMDERARELFLEEFRHAELSRVSYCLALSGKPDEWGNVYDVDTYDKQQGTDPSGGSYWYQRVIHYNDYYGLGNQGRKVDSKNSGGVYTYKINKRNLYFPIPNVAITQNSLARIAQNYGYDGYDASVERWMNWQEAVADEDALD